MAKLTGNPNGIRLMEDSLKVKYLRKENEFLEDQLEEIEEKVERLESYGEDLRKKNRMFFSLLTALGLPYPLCPCCGSDDGVLGTDFAYFICKSCGTERYWTPDYTNNNAYTWEEIVMMSPFGRARRLLRHNTKIRIEIDEGYTSGPHPGHP